MSFTVSLYLDLAPKTDSFSEEVIEGLSRSQKTLPSKFFYDGRGSQLFDQICELEEYYPTRTELRILSEHMPEILEALGQSAILIEYGSGTSTKTRLLLDNLTDADSYVPIDISREHLIAASEHIQKSYPHLTVLPVCADYSQRIPLNLNPTPGSRITVFFPGSTIGNFRTDKAVEFLSRLCSIVGPGGGVLIGVDLVKDVDILKAAYDDALGVTALFNQNILMHINARMAGCFDPDMFAHRAIWNEEEQRIEMHLESRDRQTVELGDTVISFNKGETILTEYSHKYTLESFASLADQAGFTVDHVWTDPDRLFSVQYLTAVTPGRNGREQQPS
ncbi:MAG: L-histidine N(alpha)-methyltransferase [Bacteroidetes bacterium CG12_big_fil_rev_8_21_14_0_65_60_17]|nr:MAG: L-histidine N(alpha)-methyltransferase [Bacteroidetes bacterium CG12_big_fil_rev_8_21_14_0_65_60_17]